MFCKNCGQKLEEDSKFCIKCGTPVNTSSVPNTPPTAEAFSGVTTEQTQKNAVGETPSQKSEPEVQTDKKHDNLVKYIVIITGILFVSALIFHNDIIGIIAVVAIIASVIISIIQVIKKAKAENAAIDKKNEIVDPTICPNCKEPIGKNDGYCEKCGATIDNPKRNKVFWWVFTLVLGISFGIWVFITIIHDWSDLITCIGIIPALILAFIFAALFTNKLFAKRK